MPDEHGLPTPAEQDERFQRDWTDYLNAMQDWRTRGEVGPRPPRPVAPHTPGWRFPLSKECNDG